MKGVDGILIPGGFGGRGVEGTISSIKYARENRIPFFGICLGMQVAIIEIARDLCSMKHANSSEFDPESPYPVVHIMEAQRSVPPEGIGIEERVAGDGILPGEVKRGDRERNHAKQDQPAADRLADEEDVFFSMRFLLQRPLLKAILSEQPTVLLIDEIDRSDTEFEAFLLEVLSDFQVSVPELGTLAAVHRPLVVLTSNNTRELSEALKRRCLYLFIDYPTIEQEMAVVRLKVPGLSAKLARQAVGLVHTLRSMDLRESPSI